MYQENECARSPTKEHQWVYPILDDSIDKNRLVIEPYCKYCFVKIKTTQMKKRTCPSCGEQIEVLETENKENLKFIAHTRIKPKGYEDEETIFCHLRFIEDEPCPGSDQIFVKNNPSIYSLPDHRTFTD